MSARELDSTLVPMRGPDFIILLLNESGQNRPATIISTA
jgi:hypothetical protein